METKFKTLCLFLPTGRTYTFKDVTLTVDNETVLVFHYTAMSDSNSKTMVVYKTQIVGWSFLEPDDELPF